MKISLKSRAVFAATTIIGIFFADLTISILNKFIMKLSNRLDPKIVTLIGMFVVLALFYVFVSNIQKISDWSVRIFVKLGRRYIGRSIGLYTVLAVLALAVFSGYYWAWFDRSFPSELWGMLCARFEIVRGLF